MAPGIKYDGGETRRRRSRHPPQAHTLHGSPYHGHPVQEQAVNSWHTRKTGGAGRTCALCMELLSWGAGPGQTGDVTRLPGCGHSFHTLCLSAKVKSPEDGFRCFVCEAPCAKGEVRIVPPQRSPSSNRDSPDDNLSESMDEEVSFRIDAGPDHADGRDGSASSQAKARQADSDHGEAVLARTWRAARKDPRFRLVREVFRECDIDKNGRLNLQELGAFAVEAGFDFAKFGHEAWEKEYNELCSDHNLQPKWGLHEAAFTKFVNDQSDAGMYLRDTELEEMLVRLKATHAWRCDTIEAPKAETEGVTANHGRHDGREAPNEGVNSQATALSGRHDQPELEAHADSAHEAPAPAHEAPQDARSAASGQSPAPKAQVLAQPMAANDWLGRLPTLSGPEPAAPGAEEQRDQPSGEASPGKAAQGGALAEQEQGDALPPPSQPDAARTVDIPRADRAFRSSSQASAGAAAVSAHAVDDSGPAHALAPVVDERLQAWLQPLRQTEENKRQVESCLQALQDMVNERLPGGCVWQVCAFGSVVSGFATRGCDLDAVVCNVDEEVRHCREKTTAYMKVMLGSLVQVIQSTPFQLKEAVLSARVPILKLRFRGQEIDLSMNNMQPLRNTRLLRAYAALDVRVVELGLIVKNWAKEKRLCGAAVGHLSSYAFTLMVIYFLQVSCNPPLPCFGSGNSFFMNDTCTNTLITAVQNSRWSLRESLSALVISFFHFYAVAFSWGEEVVSVRLGRRESAGCPEFQDLRGHRERRLQVEDPFERSRNLRDVLWEDHEWQLREAFRAMDAKLWNLNRQPLQLSRSQPEAPPWPPRIRTRQAT